MKERNVAINQKPTLSVVPGNILQRKCACGTHTAGNACDECSKKKEEFSLQRMAIHKSSQNEVPPIVHEVLQSPGESLDTTTRAFFEPRFHQDFSRVRIHSDSKAAESARAVNALAYTVGRDVVFNAGQYAPESEQGRKVLAHELTHVVQQSYSPLPIRDDLRFGKIEDKAESEAEQISKGIFEVNHFPSIGVQELQRLCSPAATCAAPVVGSTGEFRAGLTVTEASPRDRRKKMTPDRAIATGHSGRAKQAEKFLESESPGLLANVHGIFIDQDTKASALVQDCAAWKAEALPAAAPTPPGMGGATKPCMFIPGALNQQALAFNTTKDAKIDGKPRAEWRVDALQILTHEIEHQVFDIATHPTLPGITTATCTRANLSSDLSEMAAFLSEFPIVFRAIPAGAPAGDPMRKKLDDWFKFILKDAGNNFKGMMTQMGCLCECAEVDAFVTDTFNFVGSTWSAAEKNAFHTEARKPVWGLRWPIAPSP